MSSIIAIPSGVENFAAECQNGYVELLNTVNGVIGDANALYMEVSAANDRICSQILRAQSIMEDVNTKANKFENLMLEAQKEMEAAQAQIDYIMSHPRIVTYTDDNGNSFTVEEYDEAGLASATNRLNNARQEFLKNQEKLEEALRLGRQTKEMAERMVQIRQAIVAVGQSIQNDMYEIQKYARAIAEEGEYNISCLRNVLEKLGVYMNTPRIVLPTVTVYDSFASGASGGGASPSYSGGGASVGRMGGVAAGAALGAVGGAAAMGAAKSASGSGKGGTAGSGKASSGGGKNVSDAGKAVGVGGRFKRCFNKAMFEFKRDMLPEKYSDEHLKNLLDGKREISVPKRTFEDNYGSGEFIGVRGAHFDEACVSVIREQGKNSFNKVGYDKDGKAVGTFGGTCGPTSLRNAMWLLGNKSVTEEETVRTAYLAGLCNDTEYDEKGKIADTGGGTSARDLVDLANKFDMQAACTDNITPEDIEKTVMRGGAVILGIHASDLNSENVSRDAKDMNHWVAVVGVIRDRYTHQVTDIIVKDTGGFSFDTVTISVRKYKQMQDKTSSMPGVCMFKKETALW